MRSTRRCSTRFTGPQSASGRITRYVLLSCAAKAPISAQASISRCSPVKVSARRSATLLAPQTESGANYFQKAATCWRDLPVPVIAALQGSVFGAGLQIAMGADLRYASADARLSIMEIKWGLIPDMALTATMPSMLAEDKVRELAYTGRLVSADEAASLGMVTSIVDEPLASATAVAHEIASKSPDAIRAIKRLTAFAWRGSVAETLRLEAELQAAVMAADNQKEAAMANLQNRPPVFADPES